MIITNTYTDAVGVEVLGCIYSNDPSLTPLDDEVLIAPIILMMLKQKHFNTLKDEIATTKSFDLISSWLDTHIEFFQIYINRWWWYICTELSEMEYSFSWKVKLKMTIQRQLSPWILFVVLILFVQAVDQYCRYLVHDTGSYTLITLVGRGQDTTDTILQTTFSNVFSWIVLYCVVFRFKFHWTLTLRIPLTTSQHWFREWLGAEQATSHFLNQFWLILLTHIWINWPQCVKVAEDDIAFKLAILKKSLHLNDNTCFCSIIQSSKLFLGSLLAKNNFFCPILNKNFASSRMWEWLTGGVALPQPKCNWSVGFAIARWPVGKASDNARIMLSSWFRYSLV